MVNIIKDTSGLVKEDGSLFLSENSEYVKVYNQIINALKSGADLTIVVRDSSIFDWFDKMSERYEGNYSHKRCISFVKIQNLAFIKINARKATC